MLKRASLLAVLAAAFLSSTALAADLWTKAPAYMPPAVPLWAGFYAGLNAGGSWATVETPFSSSNLSGLLGGGQLGYNWQANQVVFGIEGDFQGSTQSTSNSGVIAGIPFTVDQKLPWFATFRGRLGFGLGSWLLYVTGGAAWMNYQMDVSALGGAVSDHTMKAAWTVGGGVEWMFEPHWSARLEYLYLDSSDTSVTLFGTTFTGHAKDNIVRLGVNYHF